MKVTLPPSHTRTTTICAAVAFIVFSVTVFAGCDGKDKKAPAVTKSAGQMANDPLLSKLPSSTAGFVIMDFSGQGYKEFRNSPLGKTQNAKESIDALVEKVQDGGSGKELAFLMQRLLESGMKLGVVAADGSYTLEKVLSRSVVFGGPTPNATLPFSGGLILQAAPGVDMTEKLAVLRESLSASSLALREHSVTGATKSFAVNLPNISSQIYVAANKDILGAAVDNATLEAMFSSSNTGTIEAILASSEYKRAISSIGAHDKPLAFTFVSLSRLRPLFDMASKVNSANQFKPEEIPFDAFAMQSSFPKEYVHNIGVAITPKTQTQTTIFTALQSGALSPSTIKLPQDSALAVSIDTHFLRQLDPMLKSIDQGSPIGLSDHAKRLESITIGLRNNPAGSPLPDVFIVLESSGREALAGLLSSGVELAMSVTGQSTTWQTKDIDGAPTKFVPTLIGAGVYMTSPAKSQALLIGTSDSVVRDLLATQSGKKPGIASSIPEHMKTLITSANVASFYFNFRNVADVLESAKNTLAMFTGGNSELNEMLESTNIRSLGLSAGSVSYSPGVLSINSSVEAVAQ